MNTITKTEDRTAFTPSGLRTFPTRLIKHSECDQYAPQYAGREYPCGDGFLPAFNVTDAENTVREELKKYYGVKNVDSVLL